MNPILSNCFILDVLLWSGDTPMQELTAGTAGTQKWKWMEENFPFQVGDF